MIGQGPDFSPSAAGVGIHDLVYSVGSCLFCLLRFQSGSKTIPVPTVCLSFVHTGTAFFPIVLSLLFLPSFQSKMQLSWPIPL